MRFSELKPEFQRIYRGGSPTDEFRLVFTCPSCGHPSRVTILVGPLADGERGVWSAWPLPGDPGWADSISILPSIDNTGSGHGPGRPPCGFHGRVAGGEVA